MSVDTTIIKDQLMSDVEDGEQSWTEQQIDDAIAAVDHAAIESQVASDYAANVLRETEVTDVFGSCNCAEAEAQWRLIHNADPGDTPWVYFDASGNAMVVGFYTTDISEANVVIDKIKDNDLYSRCISAVVAAIV